MLLVALLPVPMLLVALLPVPMLLDEDSDPVLPEEDELVAVLLAVEPVPVLDSDVAVIVEPDVMLLVALDECPVPILLVDPVPMLLVDWPYPYPYPMVTGISPGSAQMQGQLSE